MTTTFHMMCADEKSVFSGSGNRRWRRQVEDPVLMRMWLECLFSLCGFVEFFCLVFTPVLPLPNHSTNTSCLLLYNGRITQSSNVGWVCVECALTRNVFLPRRCWINAVCFCFCSVNAVTNAMFYFSWLRCLNLCMGAAFSTGSL